MANTPTPPGQQLAHELHNRGWDTIELAQRSGLPLDMIRGVLNGDRYITEVMSIRISRALDTNPLLWLDLQRRYLDELSGPL